MADLIYDEMTLFAICMLLGAMLAMVYDIIRIFRLLVPHADIIVDIEDLVFWIFTAWMVFRTLVIYNRGALRAYAFIGMFLGVILYSLTLSKLLMYIVRRMVPYWKRFFSLMGRPFRIFGHFIRKTLKNMASQVKIAIKGR